MLVIEQIYKSVRKLNMNKFLTMVDQQFLDYSRFTKILSFI